MINVSLIARFVVILLLIVAVIMVSSLAWAFVDGESGTIRAFLLPVAVVAVIGVTVLTLTRRDERGVSTRDGFLMVTLGWLAVSVFGAFPFYLSGAIPGFVDAFFETMSGFTTTGASILTEIESLPRSILFWRSLTHWLGGMGIIVLTVAIFPILGIGGLQLLKAEAPGPRVDKLTPKVTETAKILWASYLLLSFAETVLLLFGGLNLFDALTHTFGTMATGGFSPKNASVGHYDSAYVDAVITLFMVLAGINFVMYHKIATRRYASIVRDTEFRVYISIFVVVTAITTLGLVPHYGTVSQSVRYASFQVASILTTTGYATGDFAAWPYVPQIMLFLLMFIGGSSGSTGGGIKIVRIVTMIKQGWNEMRYLVYPNGVFTIRLSGERLRKDIVYAITGFVMLYMVLLLVTMVVVAAAGNDILTALSTALATLGNIGPGFGRIGPTLNYAFFPGWLKVYLAVIMMLGRLEIYTVLVLFTARYWRVQ
ncbi:MAG: TrkH family potassium uptake protein [Spirochaeta sp.]|jgi:trk system potassium uptake protein TrkH|nr:TrkH family potassium uptake protein [Spirochaeta sp.]